MLLKVKAESGKEESNNIVMMRKNQSGTDSDLTIQIQEETEKGKCIVSGKYLTMMVIFLSQLTTFIQNFNLFLTFMAQKKKIAKLIQHLSKIGFRKFVIFLWKKNIAVLKALMIKSCS